MTKSSLPTLIAVGALLVAGAAFAEETGKNVPPPPPGPATVRVVGSNGQPVPAPEPPPMSEVERYCTNISNPALDARNSLQLAQIQDAESKLSTKIDELEAKRQEVQGWMAERKAFIESTSGIMIDIYASMKPDAAAAQMTALARPVAASILTRLKPRQASAILSEMPAPVAAEIGGLIVRKTDRATASVPETQPETRS